jgi:putative ABC transport system permease protein
MGPPGTIRPFNTQDTPPQKTSIRITRMSTFLNDMRVAVRSLSRTPGFAAIIVLTLSLGIGATAAIFSVLQGVLLRPLPYPNPDRIIQVWTENAVQGWPEDVSSYHNFADWREQSRAFAEMAGYSGSIGTVTGDGETQEFTGAAVVPTFFDVMGVRAAIGRTLEMADQEEGRPVIVISDELWRQRYSSDPGIVGKGIVMNGVSREIVGVMPPAYNAPTPDAQYWVPFPATIAEETGRGSFWMSVRGRLNPGVTMEEATAEMHTIARRLQEEYPESNERLGITIVPLHEQVVRDIRSALVILMAAVGVVLLIACANVANLLLARAATQTREIALRAALGAGRGRIVRQLLTESLCLALAGAAGGMLLAIWGVDILRAFAPEGVPRLDEVSLDRTVVAFTLGVSLLTALLFGLPPAFRASAVNLSETLKEGSRAMTAAAGNRMRRGLVMAQIALALVLLIGAGLLLESFRRIQNVDPGFQTDGVISARLTLPGDGYAEAATRLAFFEQFLERSAALPGVQSIGLTSSLPLDASVSGAPIRIEGRPPAPELDEREVRRTIISPDYFRAMGSTIVSGRNITREDISGGMRVTVVNETLVREQFGGADPVGRRMRFGTNPEAPWVTVVGVVRDIQQEGFDEYTRPEFYVPVAQLTPRSLRMVARAGGEPERLVAGLREVVAGLDANLALARVETMESLKNESLASRRFSAFLLAAFSGVALLLSVIGIYGVMSYAVAQRRQEVGIRMALGARASQVLKLVLREAMTLAGVGVVIGLVLSFLLTRLLASLLFGVGATHPLTFALTTALLLGVALLASAIPARRASLVEPLVALRNE